MIEELLETGGPRPGDKNPDSAWRLMNYCRLYTTEVIEKIAEIMRQGDARVALAAASLLLDRGWGKAIQQVEVGKPGDFAELSDAQLEEFITATEIEIERKDRLTVN